MRSPTTCSSDEPDPWAHSPSTSRPGPQPVLAVCDAPKARRPGERRGAEWIGRFKANGSFSIAAEVKVLFAMPCLFLSRIALRPADVAARGSCFSSRSTRGRLMMG
jgi:hypothetical protein